MSYKRDVNWATFKTFANTKKIPIQYLEFDTSYEVVAIDGNFTIICVLDKQTPNTDTTEFETNYKANANKSILPLDDTGREIISFSPFSNASGFRFRGASMQGMIPANSTENIDYLIVQERHINGGRLIIDNIGANDKITFQVVDKDNIMQMGANTVLDQFITDFYIPSTGDLEVILDYPAKIPAGLYLRLKYTSTHASGCELKCNLFLHWKAA